MNPTFRPRIEAPANDAERTYTTLAYVEAYDAVLDCDYAFVAYRETDSSGAWRVRIRSSQTAGAVFEPELMRGPARAASARGETHFVWGFQMEPSAGDARQVEFRVLVADGSPQAIEMVARMRRADGSPAEPVVTTFAWPED